MNSRTVTLASAIAASGVSMELGTQQIVGVSVHNFSGFWLRLGNRDEYVPPYTIGWAVNLRQLTSSLQVLATPPPGITNPTGAPADGTVIITVDDQPVAASAGSPSGNGYGQIVGGLGTTFAPFDTLLSRLDMIAPPFINNVGYNLAAVGKLNFGAGVSGSSQENMDHIQDRTVAALGSGSTVVLAGVLTVTTFNDGAGDLGRLLFAQLSSSAAGTIELEHQNFGVLYTAQVLAGTSGPTLWYGNAGFRFLALPTRFFRVRCSVGATISWNIGIGGS